MADLEVKLPAFLDGNFQPRDTSERLALAEICRARRFHHASARLLAETFAAEARLADDLNAGHRYNAACSAALAAAGQGEDAGELDDRERSRLRCQALDWLRADLDLHARQLQSDRPADRAGVQQALKRWQQDSDLAGLRDRDVLAKLSAEERLTCERLWNDVAALLDKSDDPAKKGGKR